ncbi:septum formation inhibitor Maf [uncultured Marixanthomonas sp.]|uniref:septum formation inhibitor Maf n=1 Tax=uncultured Marixanthomonas sp. TaxID=757245 RepID=UPI0030DCA8FB|tara:strand:- start:109244 stop:110191 length:948 start_codon:yes stop_codon:yes gene_type:complete
MNITSKNTLYKAVLIISIVFFSQSCKDSEHNLIPNSNAEDTDTVANNRQLPEQFKEYWYAGKAELTSYKLMQERYGEIRQGTAVTVFVTEDFLPGAQVKADVQSKKNVSVLKLNKTKKFTTGIYPYSIMTSTFNPIKKSQHALKISNSVQEWCGQVYMQLNNRERFNITSHSYFEGEADQELTLDKTWLEDELWNLVRINPEELPTGDMEVIPSFEFSRMRHKEVKAYRAHANIKQGDSLSVYSLHYPMLERELILYFNSSFPYEIEKWEETNGTHPSDSTRLKTTAHKIKRIRNDYWNLKQNKDTGLRDTLGLK